MRRPGLIAAAIVLAGCSSSGDGAPQTATARQGKAVERQAIDQLDPKALPRDAIVVDRIGGPVRDLAGAARRPTFRAAVTQFERESGGRRVAVDGLPGAAGFRIPSARVDSSLVRWNRDYRRRGVSVIRFEANYGYAPDGVLVLPTTDQFEVVRAAGTDGVNWDILNAGVLRWLRRLYRDEPFVITGAGIDFVEGYFRAPVAAPLALARRFYKFCPDIVDQGTETVAALAKELGSTNALYCWWD